MTQRTWITSKTVIVVLATTDATVAPYAYIPMYFTNFSNHCLSRRGKSYRSTTSLTAPKTGCRD